MISNTYGNVAVKYTTFPLDLIPYSTENTYIKSTTVYVLSLDLGLPQPLSRKRVCPLPEPKGGGGTHSLACG